MMYGHKEALDKPYLPCAMTLRPKPGLPRIGKESGRHELQYLRDIMAPLLSLPFYNTSASPLLVHIWSTLPESLYQEPPGHSAQSPQCCPLRGCGRVQTLTFICCMTLGCSYKL